MLGDVTPSTKQRRVLAFTVLAIVGVVVLLSIGKYLRDNYEFGLGGGEDKVEACVKRGRDYFIEIGSWPRLSDGRDAATVAGERCHRQPNTAF